MGLAKLKSYVTVEEYLAGENDGATRHEYIHGEIYTMTGSSDRHNRISFNLAKKIDAKLNPKGDCQVFMTDMKLQADEATFYYPDVFVACDNPDRYFRHEPILIVEVLSPSTESVDRREKLKVYRQISSLREYVIVAQDKIYVELHQRQSNGDWTREIFTETEEFLELQAVETEMSVAEIYRGVDLEN